MKHQLALNRIPVDIDYSDDESIIRGFLMLSALNRMGEFNFKHAFDKLGEVIRQKLIEHGCCGFDEFLEYHDMTFYVPSDAYAPFVVATDYIYIGEDDVKEAIARMFYEKLVEAFSGSFDDLEEIMRDIDNANHHWDEQEMVLLFDRVIHAEHLTGDVFEDLDIDSIKSDLDNELIELMGIEV